MTTASIYKNLFGKPSSQERNYHNLRVTRSTWDSNIVAANTKYFGFIYEGIGGPFAVVPYEKINIGQIPPLFGGHKSAVLDIAFHPFNENLICSVSEDSTGMIWSIPEGGLTRSISDPLKTLQGHKGKVGSCQFNPVANNVLATSSADLTVKTWDVEAGTILTSLEGAHTDIIFSTEWNHNGSQLVSTAKDKKVRLFDPRSNKVTQETLSHEGTKSTRGIFIRDNVLTSAEHEFKLFDPRNFAAPLTTTPVSSSSGALMPFFDQDNSILYLAGKDDTNIRYFEMLNEAPYFRYISQYSSGAQQRGLCFLPKRAVDVGEREIARALKLTSNSVEPISFRLPGKTDLFQEGIYPDAYAGVAALDTAAWVGGANAEPKTCSLVPK